MISQLHYTRRVAKIRAMSATIEQPQFLTLREVAKTIQVSRTTAYTLVKQGRLPSVRIGGQIRFPRSAFEAWLADREDEAMERVKARGLAP